MSKPELSLIVTSFPDENSAATFITNLLNQRIISCGSIFTRCRSIYRWQGKIEDNSEVVVHLKTRRSIVEEVKSEIEKHHTYKVPEIIEIRPDNVNESYLNWLLDVTSSD